MCPNGKFEFFVAVMKSFWGFLVWKVSEDYAKSFIFDYFVGNFG